MSLAKGLAGGVPIGAILARDEVAEGFAPGVHASTFGGNPLACAAAETVLRVMEEDKVLDHVVKMGDHLAHRLTELVNKHPSRCKEVRGRGLLRGVQLDGDAAPIVVKCRERGLLLSAAGGTVVRFAPALIVSQAELDEAIDILDAVIAA
jgi:acetylornithine/succinyldiaminopimelate/putrescine aminotransferase